MFYTIRKIVDTLTFPGVILHEWAHKKFCEISKVRVIKVKYLQFRGREAGYVLHEPAQSFFDTFLISTGPIFVNTFFCFLLAGIAFSMDGNIFELKKAILLWVAFSFGSHSFPSDADAGVVLDYSRRQIREHLAVWHIFAYPFYFLIKVLNFLRYFGSDYIYAVLLIVLAWYYILQ